MYILQMRCYVMVMVQYLSASSMDLPFELCHSSVLAFKYMVLGYHAFLPRRLFLCSMRIVSMNDYGNSYIVSWA